MNLERRSKRRLNPSRKVKMATRRLSELPYPSQNATHATSATPATHAKNLNLVRHRSRNHAPSHARSPSQLLNGPMSLRPRFFGLHLRLHQPKPKHQHQRKKKKRKSECLEVTEKK